MPEALKPLIERQAFVVTTSSFRTDIAGLAGDMREIMARPRWGLIGVMAGALALTGIVIIAIEQTETASPPTQPAATMPAQEST